MSDLLYARWLKYQEFCTYGVQLCEIFKLHREKNMPSVSASNILDLKKELFQVQDFYVTSNLKL